MIVVIYVAHIVVILWRNSDILVFIIGSIILPSEWFSKSPGVFIISSHWSSEIQLILLISTCSFWCCSLLVFLQRWKLKCITLILKILSRIDGLSIVSSILTLISFSIWGSWWATLIVDIFVFPGSQDSCHHSISIWLWD